MKINLLLCRQDQQRILFVGGKAMGTRKYIVTLTSEERQRLARLVSSGKDKAYRIKHANILLAADENGPDLTSQDIAKAFSCHLNTVSGICQRFVEQGLEAALDRKKRQTPPTPRKLDGRGEAKLIALACRKPPDGCSHWALRLLADELVELGVVDSISHETVRRTLKKTNLSRTCERVG
jgi:transposase